MQVFILISIGLPAAAGILLLVLAFSEHLRITGGGGAGSGDGAAAEVTDAGRKNTAEDRADRKNRTGEDRKSVV